MKRVVVLNQFALPREQGGGTRHADLFSRVDGWQALLVAGNRNHYTQRPYSTADPAFKLVAVPPQNGGPLQRLASWIVYSIGAARWAYRARPAVVYASTPHLMTPIVGWAVSRLIGARYVLEVRDLWPESFVAAGLLEVGSPMHRILAAMEAFAVRHADHIVTVTPGWEQHLQSLGAHIADISVIPNGTEPYSMHVNSSEREELRAGLGISGVTAVFAGAHGPKDGLDLVLDAAKEVPDVTFLLIGDGTDKRRLQERAELENIKNVKFRDPVSKNDLPRLLAACDIGIHCIAPLPVFQLGMSPNKLFDYLAAGLPVASNADQALSAVLSSKEIGAVGPHNSLAQGVRAILAADRSTRSHWHRNAEEILKGAFSRTASARHLGAVLDDQIDFARKAAE